jgi:hypothetical protein
MANATATNRYYFNMGTKIYFGTYENYRLFKSMERHPYHEVEQEAERLNRQGGFVAPADDDFVLDEDEE